MRKGCTAIVIAVVAGLLLASPSRAQNAPAKAAAPAAAPRHDISGIWTPARSPSDGIGALGARDMPEDGKPEHQPHTPLWRGTR